MNRYTVTLSRSHWRKIYQTFVDAETEEEALSQAIKEAEEKGKSIPEEVWTNIKLHK